MTAVLERTGSVHPPEATPAERGPGRVVTVLLAAGAATLPLLQPTVGGNASPADLPILLAVVATAIWLLRSRAVIRLPYLLGEGLMVLGGALAAFLRADAGSSLALVQDLVVFAWGMALANAFRSPVVVRAVTTTWAYAAIAWAFAFEAAWMVGFSPLSGVNARNGLRLQGTLGDPNVAANYLVVSLFVILAFGRPRRRWLRWLAVIIILIAMALTGSNGGAVSLIVATLVSTFAWLWRKHGAAPVVALGAVLILVVGAGASGLHLGALEQRAADATPILRDSLGRGSESSGSRSTLLRETAALYEQTGPFGVGPGRTKDWLAKEEAAYVKEAHSDYTATVVERGVIGALGLLLLGLSLVRRASRVLAGPLRPGYVEHVPSPQMLLGALAAVFVAASFYEVLHFRHVWALFGLIAGFELWGREGRRP